MTFIQEIQCPSILSRSRLPGVDFVINPYRGCAHGCAYCYVQNMPGVCDPKRPWGSYVDVKVNVLQVFPCHPAQLYQRVTYLSSVTDCYQPIEATYGLTHHLLEKLLISQPVLTIQTKSSLVLRDLELLQKFSNVTVGMTIITLDEDLRQRLEPGADSIEARLAALQTLHAAGIATYIFVGPILPLLTDWEAIVARTQEFTTFYYFDWLNTRGCLESIILKWLGRNYPGLKTEYQALFRSGIAYWDSLRQTIALYCQIHHIKSVICF